MSDNTKDNKQTQNKPFNDELLKIIKESVRERGIENSIHDTIANQYVIEQVQTEFHCILNALITVLLDKKLIDEESLNTNINKNIEIQEKMLKEELEKEQNSPSTT